MTRRPCKLDFSTSMGVCPGRACTGPCPADDCFIHRRQVGYPDMMWDESTQGPQPPMSQHASDGIAWLMTEEGQQAAAFERMKPTIRGDHVEEDRAAYEAYRQAVDEFCGETDT